VCHCILPAACVAEGTLHRYCYCKSVNSFLCVNHLLPVGWGSLLNGNYHSVWGLTYFSAPVVFTDSCTGHQGCLTVIFLAYILVDFYREFLNVVLLSKETVGRYTFLYNLDFQSKKWRVRNVSNTRRHLMNKTCIWFKIKLAEDCFQAKQRASSWSSLFCDISQLKFVLLCYRHFVTVYRFRI
jgi:hypothetical protein